MAFNELPSHWTVRKLPEIGEINRGRSRHRPRWADHLYGGPYPFIQTLDIRNSEGRITRHTQTYSEAGLEQSKMWPAETLCISIAGNNIAETGVLMFPACFPDSVVGFRANESICDVFYVGYVLQNLKRRIKNEATGSTQLNLNIETLNEIEIPLPPLAEQKAIVSVLGTLDDKIELNRRMNATLEALAQALFKSWFVDFDPVKAKAAGRAPEGMDAATAALFPSEFQDSELGVIPKGWEVCSISDLVNAVGGGTPNTKEASYWNAGLHHWATPKDLSNLAMPVLLETERKITDAGLSKISSGLLPVGSVLMSSRAPIGYLAIAEIPVAINQGFIGMLPKRGISNLFVLFWAKANQQPILDRANGSTFLEISKANFRPIQLVCPEDRAMEAFDKVVQPLYRHIVNNERESQRLAQIRDALLPKLISGQLRIPAAEAMAEAAL